MTRLTFGFATLALCGTIACGGDGAQNGSPTGPSGTSTSTTPQASCTAPGTPSGLRVVSVVGTTVELAWTGVANAADYLVIVGTTADSSDILLTNTTQARYQWGGVKPGRHFARVQAHNACGTSGSSNTVEFTVAG